MEMKDLFQTIKIGDKNNNRFSFLDCFDILEEHSICKLEKYMEEFYIYIECRREIFKIFYT